jgi:hypothetical protein
VAVVRNYAYVADEDGGLVILKFVPTVSASIPTTGGNLASSFDQTSYTFAAGTFAETVIITHTPRFLDDIPSPGNLTSIGHVFEVTAHYSGTGQPAQPAPGRTYTITVRYADIEKGPATESTLALYSWDGNQWVKEPTSVVNEAANIITATPAHLSLWAVLGETRRVCLPIVLR